MLQEIEPRTSPKVRSTLKLTRLQYLAAQGLLSTQGSDFSVRGAIGVKEGPDDPKNRRPYFLHCYEALARELAREGIIDLEESKIPKSEIPEIVALVIKLY